MKEIFLVKIPKRQALEIAKNVSEKFEDFYQDTKYSLECLQDEPIMVLTFDAKGIIMRNDSLKKSVLKSKQKEHHLQSRLSPGEKRNRKRMAQVASVYQIERFERDYKDVISSLRRNPGKERKKRPKPVYKQGTASILRSSEEVIFETFAEAHKRDPEHKKEWIVLVDGDPHQIRRVKRAARKFGVKISIIMDLIHVTEYLWDAARAFPCKSRKSQEKWVFERIEKILQGKAGEVAGGIGRSATLRRFSTKRRKPIDKCIRYLKKHLKYLKYNRALSKGYPICTGVIEGACRYLVKDRMEKTGCRWSIEGAEAILKIRALRANEDFEEYWSYLCDKEKKEIYCSKYKDGKIPEISKPQRKPVLTVIKGGK